MQEIEEELGGYLFKNGERIDFEIIKSNKIKHSRSGNQFFSGICRLRRGQFRKFRR